MLKHSQSGQFDAVLDATSMRVVLDNGIWIWWSLWCRALTHSNGSSTAQAMQMILSAPTLAAPQCAP